MGTPQYNTTITFDILFKGYPGEIIKEYQKFNAVFTIHTISDQEDGKDIYEISIPVNMTSFFQNLHREYGNRNLLNIEKKEEGIYICWTLPILDLLQAKQTIQEWLVINVFTIIYGMAPDLLIAFEIFCCKRLNKGMDSIELKTMENGTYSLFSSFAQELMGKAELCIITMVKDD